MTQALPRNQLYRTHLSDYAEKWQEFFAFKREGGILEVRMHSNGGPCSWDLEIHRAFIPAFADIHHDPENECVILTGTGDTFLASFEAGSWDRNGFRGKFLPEHGYDIFFQDQTKEPFALLNLDIPIIAAINGPLFIHAELALLNDIVLCSENTTINDGHFANIGIVPGDGVHTLFRELLGHNRGRYFLLTGQTLDAAEALRLGLVSEVLPQDKLLDRAWEIARKLFMTKNRIQRRVTRAVFIQPWRELFTRELAFGQGLESWACHAYWPFEDPGYDVTRLKAAESDKGKKG
jgi:enoyl-CoA hydratase/carnithine racemase